MTPYFFIQPIMGKRGNHKKKKKKKKKKKNQQQQQQQQRHYNFWETNYRTKNLFFFGRKLSH